MRTAKALHFTSLRITFERLNSFKRRSIPTLLPGPGTSAVSLAVGWAPGPLNPKMAFISILIGPSPLTTL